MPRNARQTPGGYVYHVLNRAAAHLTLFAKPADYDAFVDLLDEALAKHPCRLLAYCVMPTHWHFVLWPQGDGEMSALLRWLTLTHAVRWQTHFHCIGSGHVYQNRFKAFPVAEDDHLYAVLRYVERNPLRAGLVKHVCDWPWSSAACRRAGGEASQRLHPWPVPYPRNWLTRVEKPQTEAELAALRQCVVRGRPYGSETWVEGVVERLGLQSSVRPRGRPHKQPPEDTRNRGSREK